MIKVRFRVAARPHGIRRVVTVDSNSVDSSRKRIRIIGRVEAKND